MMKAVSGARPFWIVRIAMPITIVSSQTGTMRASERGARWRRRANAPTTYPTRNGHATPMTPASAVPSLWLWRPMIANTMIHATSRRSHGIR